MQGNQMEEIVSKHFQQELNRKRKAVVDLSLMTGEYVAKVKDLVGFMKANKIPIDLQPFADSVQRLEETSTEIRKQLFRIQS